MKKNLIISPVLLIFILSAVLFAACAHKDFGNADDNIQPSTVKASTDNKEVKTLDFVWFSDGIDGDVLKKIIKDYQVENPNIQINIIEVPFQDMEKKLKVMISSGEPPALSRLASINIGQFENSLEDLSKYFEDKEEFISQFSDSLYNFYNINGKLTCVPIDVTVNGLIYNKTAFDNAGIKVPASPEEVWTWDEWEEAMKAVMKKGNMKYGLVFDKTSHRWSTLLYQAGGSLINEDRTKVILNNKEAVRTMDFFARLHRQGITPNSVWLGNEDPTNLFLTGQAAMHFAGSWMLSYYRDNIKDFEWGVTYMPKDKVRSSIPGGKFIGAFKGSGKEKEAADFIKYFISKEVNARYCQEALLISPRKDNAQLDYSFGKKFFKIFANELEATSETTSRDWSNPKLVAAIYNDLKDAIMEVLVGQSTAQQALDKVAKKAQRVLDNN